MKQKVVGSFYIGHDQVEIVLREGTGGEFYHTPERGSIPRIKIGADYDSWNDVVKCLLHEAFEYVADVIRVRYEPSNDFGRDHLCHMFTFDHSQMSHILACVGEFIAECLPVTAESWKKWKKK